MAADARGHDPRHWTVESAATIRGFFAARSRHVVYFAGYGELGYEQEERVRSVANDVLSNWTAASVLVHAGTLLRVGGHDGIAQVYSIARTLGMETTGIYPSVAMSCGDTHRVSPCCDHVFFVEDVTWGGFLEATDVPSPTLRLHLDVSDEIVVIGGGKHAADELRAFASFGKPVRYFPAEMNHTKTLEWSRVAGVRVTDLRGAAHAVWEQLRAR
ncbi:MAG TPA: hypothetical protein VOB72_14890 [Candidatus Dormibacteraeota bacterium]|nr:hypothetical protein [Candidatus Dormibacteraeota bacterium]